MSKFYMKIILRIAKGINDTNTMMPPKAGGNEVITFGAFIKGELYLFVKR